MATYAYVVGGIVYEPLATFPNAAGYTLAQCYHPDVAANWIDVTAVTPQPQPGWTATETAGVWTFAAPPAAPAPTAAEMAQAAYDAFIAGGLTITSTGTPALNGVYAIDATSQTDISTEAQFISTFAEFTTGTTTNLPWTLANGAFVTFPTTTEFMAFVKAAGQAVAAAKLALAQAAAMPAAAATIA